MISRIAWITLQVRYVRFWHTNEALSGLPMLPRGRQFISLFVPSSQYIYCNLRFTHHTKCLILPPTPLEYSQHAQNMIRVYMYYINNNTDSEVALYLIM